MVEASIRCRPSFCLEALLNVVGHRIAHQLRRGIAAPQEEALLGPILDEGWLRARFAEHRQDTRAVPILEMRINLMDWRG